MCTTWIPGLWTLVTRHPIALPEANGPPALDHLGGAPITDDCRLPLYCWAVTPHSNSRSRSSRLVQMLAKPVGRARFRPDTRRRQVAQVGRDVRSRHPLAVGNAWLAIDASSKATIVAHAPLLEQRRAGVARRGDGGGGGSGGGGRRRSRAPIQ